MDENKFDSFVGRFAEATKIKTIAVVCLQWGDTGKGKIVDLLASDWARIIVRGTGGDNAGHTICQNGKTIINHTLPSGAFLDEKVINVMGSGMVINPRSLCSELDSLDKLGLTYNNFYLSKDATVVLPWHLMMDNLKESLAGSNKIGTTGKGIMQAYLDYYARQRIKINDLQNIDIFAKKLKHNFESAKMFLKNYSPEAIKELMGRDSLENGLYYHPSKIVDLDAVISKYLEYLLIFQDMIMDTNSFIRGRSGKDNILLEGAQGVGLSIDYGTYPYVTSSDCSVFGLAKGVGLQDASSVDLALGIVKGPISTRVGCGPFPTELGGKESDLWCNGGGNKEKELEKFGHPSVNSESEFLQGVALRQVGNEYGATTKRSRRTGWLDLPFLRHALDHHKGWKVVLTKLDVANDVEIIKICDSYTYVGPDYLFGDQLLKSGDVLHKAIPDAEILELCKPNYREFPGWKCSLKGISSFEDLPLELKTIITHVQEETGINPRIISTGPDRDETIFC